MKRHHAILPITALTLFCYCSAGLFDNLSTLLQNLSASLGSLSKELPAAAQPVSFSIPVFDEKDIIAIGNPADFSGIPVTQLMVLNQAATGGDASCGYQALKNVAIMMNGIITGKPGNTISEELQSKNVADRLFGMATADRNSRHGIWRETVIIESALIPIFQKLYIEPVFSGETILIPYSDIQTSFNDTDKKYTYNIVSTGISNYAEMTIARTDIKNAYKKYLESPNDPSAKIFKKTYRRDNLSNEFPLIDTTKPFLKDFSIEIQAYFESPQEMAQKYADFTETKRIALGKKAYEALSKDLQDNIVALIKNMYAQNRTKTPLTDEKKVTDHPAFMYALSEKSAQTYNKIIRDLPQAIDTTGDWINDKSIEILIPLAQAEFKLPEEYPIFVLQSTQTVFGLNPLEKIETHLQKTKSNTNDLFGIVLGGIDIIDPEKNNGHWLGLIFVRNRGELQLFILDSLENANRIRLDKLRLEDESAEFEEKAFLLFNQRIKKIAQAIASA